MTSASQALGDQSVPLTTYKVLYRFGGTPQGSGPTGVVDVNGLVYGTTMGGGSKTLGTVFVRGLSGKVRILHSFAGGRDGATPSGALIALNTTLYGTTQYGGAHGDGTVFAVTTSGKERVVYSFKGGSDGATPVLAGLIEVGGKLYGTTNAGGETTCRHEGVVGCGTVFTLTTSGRERVLYRFKGKPDGACPAGSLIAVDATLYGTTNFGGTNDSGSIFAVTTAGKESTLYSFRGYPDGALPYAGLTTLNGNFYGTTTLGGAYQGAGTVFEFNASSGERVLHSFRNAPDGALPYASLVESNGVLYGTTEDGGDASIRCLGHGIVGCGTIFSVTANGSLKVIHRFRARDGANPLSNLILRKNTFYGTALQGGIHDNGSLFEITP